MKMNKVMIMNIENIKIGCGGEANIFLVLKKGTNEEYAAKVPKREENTLDIEISSLNHLKQYNNPNILNIIEVGEGEIIRKDRKPSLN